MGRKIGRRTTILMVLITIVVLTLSIAFRWQTFRTQYYCWRLNETSAPEEARIYWDRLVRYVDQPDVSRELVSNLGPQTPNLVYWTLRQLTELPEESDALETVAVTSLGPLLPLVRELTARAQKDERLLAMVSHFIRLRGSSAWSFMADLQSPRHRVGVGEALLRSLFEGLAFDATEKILVAAREDSEAFEATIRMQDLRVTVEAWTLGIERLVDHDNSSYLVTGTRHVRSRPRGVKPKQRSKPG